MYSNLALQARPNSFPHSEIDVGTFKWSRRGQVDHVMGLTTYFDLSRPVLQTLPRLHCQLLWNGGAGVCRGLCRYRSLFWVRTAVHGGRLYRLATGQRGVPTGHEVER